MTPTTSPMKMMTKEKTTITTAIMMHLLGFISYSRLYSALLLLALVNPVFSAYSWGQPSRNWREPDDNRESPEFDVATSSISALVGQPVYLPCRVRNLGDRVVSWIRTQDLHILTWGTLTYTSDSRFEALHTPGTEMWILRIMSVQPRDQGKYECQVNTDPKINFAVFLTVKESDMRDDPSLHMPEESPVTITASANIEGPREQYVSRGTTVTFTCVVMAPYTTGNRPPRVVDWFHNDRLVSIQAERGGISIETEKTDLHTKSRLTVAGVTYRDAGNYSCHPAETRSATVQLIVVEGEHTEAMQRDAHPSNRAHTTQSSLRHLISFLCFLTAFYVAS